MTYESQIARDARIDVGAVLSAVIVRLPRIILVTLLLLMVTLALLMVMPTLYESSASILVESRNNPYIRATNDLGPMLTGSEAGVVSSQIELIKSRDTLLTVIDGLDLRSVSEFNGSDATVSPSTLIGSVLGRSVTPLSIDETVLNTLYDRMTVVQERDSRIISILVRSTDPQRAADIANAVANAHVARRAQLSLSDTAEASGWLREEIAKLRVSVAEAETAVANFRVDNDLFVGSNNTSLIDQQLSTIASQISAAQERKNAAQSRATLIRGMIERGQPIDGIADVRESSVIQQLSQEKVRLQGERAQRSATLLNNHPIIQALTAQIAELDNQIRIEARRVADALDAEAQIEADLEASLQTDLNRMKSSASTATQDNVTLDSLQREAAAQRNLLEGYLQRYNEAVSRTDTNSALPDVRVVSFAAPSVSPASPKTAMILVAIGIVGLATQVGIVIFGELLSGRAVIPAPVPVRPQDELDEPPFAAEEIEIEPEPVDESDPVAFIRSLAVGVESVNWSYMSETQPTGEKGQAEHLDRSVEEAGECATTYATESEPEDDSDPAEYLGTLTADMEDFSSAEGIGPETGTMSQPVPAISLPEEQKRHKPAVQYSISHDEEGILALADLTADLVMGLTHLVILAAYGEHGASEMLAKALIGNALGRGLSVALVDAGSNQTTENIGLTDLSADGASFGDVVHKSADNSFAEVPWGRRSAIIRSSNKPFTLVEALGDIYEVVILMTGRPGIASSLPLFRGLDGRLILVASDSDDFDAVVSMRDQLINVGFAQCEIAAASAREAA